MQKEPQILTSEELFVEDYLQKMNLKYIKQYIINGLKEDSKKYRVVDFYLPKLNVYVEYFEMYNSTKIIRKEYNDKAEVYFKNNLPTVILYPHELGFLDYAFHIKMLKVLRFPKFKNNWNMLKYKISRYLSIGKGYYFFSSVAFYFLFMFFLSNSLNVNELGSKFLSYFFLVISAFYFGRFITNIFSFFVRDE